MPKVTNTISPNTVKPTSQTTALKPPDGQGCCKGSFCINSKVFLFSFDGGWVDSYAIHESRWNFKSSICVGRRGLEWIHSYFADIRDWVLGKDLLRKRYRENNKVFEFCGRSNKASLFADIAVYYGGTHHGCVMILASLNRSGWCVFQKELDNFLSSENTISVVERTSDGIVGGGSMASGG